MIGWLLDTNVIAELIRPNGAAQGHRWAAGQDESVLYLSILTLGEYDKGLHSLPGESMLRPRVAAIIAALETRFAGRLLKVDDVVVRRWGAITGAVRQATGHSPPVIDTMLAATAVVHDLYLATRNVRDVQRSGVAVFNRWTDDPTAFSIQKR